MLDSTHSKHEQNDDEYDTEHDTGGERFHILEHVSSLSLVQVSVELASVQVADPERSHE
jgi:hypothetical protein